MLSRKKDRYEGRGIKYLEKMVEQREKEDPLELSLEFLISKKFLEKISDYDNKNKITWKFGKLGALMVKNLVSCWENSTAKKLGNVKFIPEISSRTGTEYFIEMFDKQELNIPFGFSRIIEEPELGFSTDKFVFNDKYNKRLILEYATTPSTSKDMLISWLDFSFDFLNKLYFDSDDLEISYQTLEQDPDAEHYFFDRFTIKNIYHFGVEVFSMINNKIDFDFENYEKNFPDDKKSKCYVHDELRNIDYFPHVVQVIIDVNKLILAVLLNNFHQERIRTSIVTTLKLSPQLAPVKCAIFPLSIVDKKTRITGERVLASFNKHFTAVLEEKGTLEMRISDFNEIGVPFYVAIDPALVDDNIFWLYDNRFGTRSEVAEEDILAYIISKINE
jgi:glycyl-tRNA synthetase